MIFIKNRPLFLFLVFFFFGSIVWAQSADVWTLSRCLEYAAENNLTIKQQKLNVALSSENLLQNSLSLLPSVNATGGQNYNFGRSVDPLTYQFETERIVNTSLGLTANFTLFSGFQRLNSIAQSNYQLKADKSSIEKTKNDVALSVVTYYLQILYNRDLVSNSETQVNLSKQQVAKAEKNLEVGNITKGDLFEIKAQLARDEYTLTNAQNQLDISKLNLIQLLDLDPSKPFDIEKPEIVLPEASTYQADEVYAAALNSQPDIKVADFRLRAAEKGLHVAYGGLSPRISLTGGANTGYSSGRTTVTGYKPLVYASGITKTTHDTVLSGTAIPITELTPFKTQLDQNLSYYVGLNVTIPLFNGWQTQAGIRRAKISYQNADLSSKITKTSLHKTINQSTADLSAARKKLDAAQNSYESLTEAFKYSQQKFDVGQINSVDYNIAKNNLARAQTDYLQAKYDLIFKSKILDFYSGKSLSF